MTLYYLAYSVGLCTLQVFRRVSVTIARSKGLAESMEFGNLF